MNQELYNNEYPLPEQILTHLQSVVSSFKGNTGINGYKRATDLINTKKCTYQQLKRIKNFFDTYNPAIQPKEEYDLNGGELMRNFVEQTLNVERQRVESSKKAKANAGMENSYRKHESVIITKKNLLDIIGKKMGSIIH